MAEKFTVELKGQALKDVKQIARLCKEDPEHLLARAFREWVRLREDLEDAEIAMERIADYERTGESIPLETVMAELGLKPKQSPKSSGQRRRSSVLASNKVRAARTA